MVAEKTRLLGAAGISVQTPPPDAEKVIFAASEGGVLPRPNVNRVWSLEWVVDRDGEEAGASDHVLIIAGQLDFLVLFAQKIKCGKV